MTNLENKTNFNINIKLQFKEFNKNVSTKDELIWKQQGQIYLDFEENKSEISSEGIDMSTGSNSIERI